MAMRFSYDKTEPAVSDGILHTEDTMTIFSRLAAKIQLRLSTLCRLWRSRKQIATDGGNQREI